MTQHGSGTELDRRGAARVVEVARTQGHELIALGTRLHSEIVEAIPELRGDETLLELLRASVEGNVETFLHMSQHGIASEHTRAPAAAIEYARRLAQRGISANALLRAYRIGQDRVLAWLVAAVDAQEPDREVAFIAARQFQAASFAYVDRVAEQVVAEYESERERWLANRNTVRAAMLATLLAPRFEVTDVGAAENALGYRLRQHHLGVVVSAEHDAATVGLRALEAVVTDVARAVGDVEVRPLFLPQDRALAWGWIPLGRVREPAFDVDQLRALVSAGGSGVRLALGRPASSTTGFRATHREALRAHAVALAGAGTAGPIVQYGDRGVQIASTLVRDLDATRELVAEALGGLVGWDETSIRLRETLAVFLEMRGSHLAASEVLHLHKNTVKYRVDKAVEARGRSWEEDRLSLELALTACAWLGPAVLPAVGSPRP